MKDGKVTLLAYTPEPEKLVAAAAKLCYSSSSPQTLMDGLTPEKTESFLEMLQTIGHESPIEHVSFTFGIEGVSRSLLAQITRHRIASYSVQSQRYVREKDFQYVTPPEIAAIPEALELYEQTMAQIGESYDRLASMLKQSIPRRLRPVEWRKKLPPAKRKKWLLKTLALFCLTPAIPRWW